MIMDTLLEMCDDTAANTGAAGTYLLGNQIPLNGPTVSPTLRNIGVGEPVFLVIQVGSAGLTTAGTAGTVQFKLVSDAQAAVATDGSATEHLATKAFTTGSTAIPAGTVLFCGAVPSGNYEAFLGLLQLTGTTALNAGKVNAFLVKNPTQWRALADAYAGSGL